MKSTNLKSLINLKNNFNFDQPTLHQLDKLQLDISEDSLLAIIKHGQLRPHDLRLTKYGQMASLEQFCFSKNNQFSLCYDKIMKLYLDEKFTLIFENLPDYFPKLKKRILALNGKNSDFRYQAGAYLSPPNSCGFAAHWDLMNVFMIQMSGSKNWKIWKPIYNQPFFSADQLNLENTTTQYCDSTSVLLEKQLTRNYGLYIPRGFIHRGEASIEGSLHITIGFTKQTVLGSLRQELTFDPTSCIKSLEALMKRSDLNLYYDNPHFLKVKQNIYSEILGIIS